MTLELETCRPEPDQARLVMDWRNDPQTLAMFYHHEPKRWPDFLDEFRADYFTDPELPPLFAVEAGRRVAFLRFQRVEGDLVDVSINVDPAARGRGIGRRALIAARPWLAARGVRRVLAEVRVENPASQAAFLQAGYALLDETEKLVEDTGERCRIRRFVLRLDD